MREGAPILHVTHDEVDEIWQFLCGKEHELDEAMVVGMGEVVRLDTLLNQLCDMPSGFGAARDSIQDDWIPFKI